MHATTDGVLLAFHDAVLDRVTDGEGAFADRTYDEVRRPRVGGREQVPTLADLFEAFPRRASTSTSSPTARSSRWPS